METQTNKPACTLTYPEARYLKHAGEILDVKVSFKIIDKKPVINIRDSELKTFESALRYLRHIQETEMVSARLTVVE